MTRPDQPLALNLARLVHRLMVDPRGWRVDRLMDELGIRPRTYRKYRSLLRDHLEHEIDPTGRWRVVEVPEGQGRYLRLQVAEEAEEDRTGFLGRIAGFWFARRVFGFAGDSALRESTRSAWADFVGGIKDKPFYLGHLMRNTDRLLHYVPDGPKDYQGHEETLALLLKALFHSRRVKLRYFSAGRGERREHVLCPLTLLLHRSALYLVAAYEPTGRPYLFALERIEAIETAEDRFKYPGPGEYDPERLFEGSFGIWQEPGGRPTTVELRFAARPWLHRYVSERAWHPSQAFTLQADGRLAMTLTVSSLVEVVPWVRGFGEDVEVVGPPELASSTSSGSSRSDSHLVDSLGTAAVQ